MAVKNQQQQLPANRQSNKHINKQIDSELSQQTEPLALYHTKTFETSKYSRVEVQFIRGESSVTRALQYFASNSKYMHYQIAELLF